MGMSKEFVEQIFDPFTREENSVTNRIQGTGLGMAITKSIVDLMGDVITMDSTPGKGSRFEVLLEFPIDTTAERNMQHLSILLVQCIPYPFFLSNLEAEVKRVQESLKATDEPEDVSPLCGMKFLCAEDNDINAEILEMLLESKGASCKICKNGQEIVDAFASVKPGDYDMILMDVQMPVMNGPDVTRAIRSGSNPLGRTIPILAMTANAFFEDMQQSRDAGMNEHLSKPVDMAVLE